ncbi:uncharacterized protein L201_000182 [Kwoniella dendrophila CBS 6074]|uniref:Uncharacterized protein n=1 Tax=Kwoniella dendrophila CBS 6074 TaxID=1295534 RepID=A0AAX4JL19_9TREE
MLAKSVIILSVSTIGALAAATPQSNYQIQENNYDTLQITSADTHSDNYTYTIEDPVDDRYQDYPAHIYVDNVIEAPEHEWIDMMAEHHTVKLVNKCRTGKPVFLYQGHAQPRGSGTIQGPLLGGIAWMDNYDGVHCQSSGVNCGVVEFTLTNSQGKGMQNSADYSLLDGPGLGHHKFHYKMDFHFTGSCTKGPGGPCIGNSPQKCPGAYLGDKTEGGAPTQCLSDNTGITITFC